MVALNFEHLTRTRNVSNTHFDDIESVCRGVKKKEFLFWKNIVPSPADCYAMIDPSTAEFNDIPQIFILYAFSCSFRKFFVFSDKLFVIEMITVSFDCIRHTSGLCCQENTFHLKNFLRQTVATSPLYYCFLL